MATRARVSSAVPGREPSFATALAHQPGLQGAFARLYATFWTGGVVDQPAKEVTRIRNARVTDCSY